MVCHELGSAYLCHLKIANLQIIAVRRTNPNDNYSTSARYQEVLHVKNLKVLIFLLYKKRFIEPFDQIHLLYSDEGDG